MPRVVKKLPNFSDRWVKKHQMIFRKVSAQNFRMRRASNATIIQKVADARKRLAKSAKSGYKYESLHANGLR
jgi:hypothetical protein